MFELGVLALARALEDGLFQSGWELHGVGTVRESRRISLGAGSYLDLLPRTDQQTYAEMLADHDVGLALMYTPHPSLVPIEMASAGMLTVTNRFENKTPDAMSAISSNLITVDPTVDGLLTGLHAAVAAVSSVQRRLAGADVRWSSDWTQSFSDELLARIVSALESTRALAL
jgi:hypothetical protein